MAGRRRYLVNFSTMVQVSFFVVFLVRNNLDRDLFLYFLECSFANFSFLSKD